MERPHLITLGDNNKFLQKYFHQIKNLSPPELLGQFYNKHVYNHNFAQMYSCFELVSQVSDVALGPLVFGWFLNQQEKKLDSFLKSFITYQIACQMTLKKIHIRPKKNNT